MYRKGDKKIDKSYNETMCYKFTRYIHVLLIFYQKSFTKTFDISFNAFMRFPEGLNINAAFVYPEETS